MFVILCACLVIVIGMKIMLEFDMVFGKTKNLELKWCWTFWLKTA